MPVSTRTKSLMRLAAGVLILGLLIISAKNLTIPSCGDIQLHLERWGLWAPVVFVLAYVIATIAFIPGLVITLVGGLAFGPWLGTLLVLIGANIGALLAFLASRFFARETIEGLLSKQAWFAKFKAAMTSDGLNYVLFIRLVPIFPFNGLNYACGLVPLRVRDYVIGSLIGMLPGTFAYVYLGAAGCKLIDAALGGSLHLGDLPPEVRNKLLIAILLLAVLSLLPLVIKKLRANG